MVPLDLLVPTKTRNFTFYDRAAILLDPDEMSAQRVRIAVSIFATPISRSLNLKYPYFKEFYGYAQGFFAGELTHEFPVNYSVQYIWDYWNEHATISHQLSSVMAKLRLFLLASIEVQAAIANTLDPTLALLIESTIPFIDAFTDGLTFDNVVPPQPVGIGNRFVNTFVHPFDLIRFKFIFGTVFQVSIDSWNLGDTVGGASPPPWPEELPYNPQNPNNQPPESSPGSADPEDPYGLAPPESSPRDPRLDPDEFSNAPDPAPPSGTVELTGWRWEAIPGVQGASLAIGCAGIAFAALDPNFGVVQGVINIGTRTVNLLPSGALDPVSFGAVFPEFNANANVLRVGACTTG